jgi:hypothetical protein
MRIETGQTRRTHRLRRRRRDGYTLSRAATPGRGLTAADEAKIAELVKKAVS